MTPDPSAGRFAIGGGALWLVAAVSAAAGAEGTALPLGALGAVMWVLAALRGLTDAVKANTDAVKANTRAQRRGKR